MVRWPCFRNALWLLDGRGRSCAREFHNDNYCAFEKCMWMGFSEY